MSELSALLRAAQAARHCGQPLLLATVVRVEGSAYRRPGARLLLTPSRRLAGSISGGCLEGDILRRAAHWTRNMRAVVKRYDAGHDDADGSGREGYGLGCGGAIDVLVERLEEGDRCDPLLFAAGLIEGERAGALVTVIASSTPAVPVGARVGIDGAGETFASVEPLAAKRALAGAGRLALERSSGLRPAFEHVHMAALGLEALVEVLVPPPHVFAFGTGHDVPPLVAAAKGLGWRVTVCSDQGRFETRERFAEADRLLVLPEHAIAETVDRAARPVAVVMDHHVERDRVALGALLASRALYIGVLGPRRRTERMMGELARAGRAIEDADLRRMHAPAGLDIGAETPCEIALAIVAEVQAELTRCAGGRLRARGGAIHVADGDGSTHRAPSFEERPALE